MGQGKMQPFLEGSVQRTPKGPSLDVLLAFFGSAGGQEDCSPTVITQGPWNCCVWAGTRLWLAKILVRFE